MGGEPGGEDWELEAVAEREEEGGGGEEEEENEGVGIGFGGDLAACIPAGLELGGVYGAIPDDTFTTSSDGMLL